MRLLNNLELTVTSAGFKPSDVAFIEKTGSLAGSFTTYTYDDGSTMTVNSSGDPVYATGADGVGIVAWGACITAIGAVGASFLSSGAMSVFTALTAAGASIDCYNGSAWR